MFQRNKTIHSNGSTCACIWPHLLHSRSTDLISDTIIHVCQHFYVQFSNICDPQVVLFTEHDIPERKSGLHEVTVERLQYLLERSAAIVLKRPSRSNNRAARNKQSSSLAC